MSLEEMIKMQKSTLVCESFVLGPHNSPSPYDIWFDRERHQTPRIKVQVKTGVGPKDKSKYVSYDPIKQDTFKPTEPKDKKNLIPNDHREILINFLKENDKAIRQYYGIDPTEDKLTEWGISEALFARIIIRRANEYFNRPHIKATLR